MTIHVKDSKLHFETTPMKMIDYRNDQGDRRYFTLDLETDSLDKFAAACGKTAEQMRAFSETMDTQVRYDLKGERGLTLEVEQQVSIRRLRALQAAGMAALRTMISPPDAGKTTSLSAMYERGTFGKVSTRRPSELYHWDCPYALRPAYNATPNFDRQLRTYMGRMHGMPRLRTIAAYVQIALEDWSK